MWLSKCRFILMQTLNLDETKATQVMAGVGRSVYCRKFSEGATPQQCIDDELIYWNE